MTTQTLTTRFLVFLLIISASMLAASSQAAGSRIYKTVDEDGNVVFTDVPPKEGEKSQAVAVETPNTFDPAPGTAETRDAWNIDQSADAEQTDSVGYQSAAIVSPSDDSSVRENAGNVSVVAELEPELQPGHKVRLMLDGKPEQEGRQTAFMLLNVDRGTHSANIEVVDASGNVLIVSEPITFTLQRYSILNAPPKPTPANSKRPSN